MLKRAAQFRTAIQTDGRFRSGVYVYSARSIKDYAGTPEKLAARIALLGFTDIYLSFGPKPSTPAEVTTHMEWRRAFNHAAHTHGMRVYAQTLESNRLFVDNQAVIDDCAAVLAFNQAVSASERFDGISADMEPHAMQASSADRPKELKLVWHGEKHTGPGRDNDLLLKRTVEVMDLARKVIGDLPLRQAVGFFFETSYDAGKVDNGSAAQFLKSCDALIVMAYNIKKERIWTMAQPTIRGAGKKNGSVTVCINTAFPRQGNDAQQTAEINTTSLISLGWDGLLDTVNYIMSKGKSRRPFLGVDIFEFQGLERMWGKN
jgi:hypothetical protein